MITAPMRVTGGRAGGWCTPAIPNGGFPLMPSVPLDLRLEIHRQAQMQAYGLEAGNINRTAQMGSLDVMGTQGSGYDNAQLLRAIISTQTGFPVRENLEAPSRILVPLETPLRNMLPRVPGQGVATSWEQTLSLGGGWGSGYDQIGGASVAQVFFAETGAPGTVDSVYARPSLSYKLMGTIGGVTGLAIAAGANYQQQYQVEKSNAIKNLMLIEEFALMQGSSTDTAIPWGDGTNALGFDGLTNLIATANGVPSAQVQTSVGAWTLKHIETQLNAIHNNGGSGCYILVNKQEKQTLSDLVEASGTIYRVVVDVNEQDKVTYGQNIAFIQSVTSDERVPVFTSRFQTPGTVFYCSKWNPDGSAAMDVDVLPQVQLPELAPNEMIQGYTAQELAPTQNAPQVFNFLVSVYEVLRMKNALVFAKDTGVTAV